MNTLNSILIFTIIIMGIYLFAPKISLVSQRNKTFMNKFRLENWHMFYIIYIIKNYLAPVLYFGFKVAISVFAVYLIFQTRVELSYERIILVLIAVLPWNIIKSIKIAGNEISVAEGKVEKNEIVSGAEDKGKITEQYNKNE